MDPYSSPSIIPNNNPYSPFPHSLLSIRESSPYAWYFQLHSPHYFLAGFTSNGGRAKVDVKKQFKVLGSGFRV